ncbi:hypothetical protein ACET3Z_021101 [Daucus carota]
MEAVEALPRWRMPQRGTVKINVHGCFFVEANGNVTGIGVVIRNSRGRIFCMLSSSLEIQNRRVNEYYAMLEGCKRAFYEYWYNFTLETDHFDSYWEWRNLSLEGVHPDHAYIVQQLNQQRKDPNFQMDVNLCDPNANELAAFLADHGARNYKTMVVIAQPFGRIFEIWNNDMGLGSADPRFQDVNEEDVGSGAVHNVEVIEQEGMEDAEVQEQGHGEALLNAEGEPVEVIEVQD